MNDFVREELELLDENIATLIRQYEMINQHRKWLAHSFSNRGFDDGLQQVESKMKFLQGLLQTV